ncbi:DedA family protein [bacterium]|nr:DedA family protein [bacterium]
MESVTEFFMHLVEKLGYLGIFIATAVESTFVPLPAEMTLIPAGILAAHGKMHYWLILLSSTAGVIVGSLVNYWLGLRFGRALIIKYGKYVLMNEEFLAKTETFFQKHGAYATFGGRLLPGLRHYIAFPAGIARMNLKRFTIATSLGGGIWMWILLQLGFMAGVKNPDGVDTQTVEQIILGLSALLVLMYFVKAKLLK